MIKSVDDLIEAVGGTKAAAKLAGVGSPAVSNWRVNGKIPANKYWFFWKALRGGAPTELFTFELEEPAA